MRLSICAADLKAGRGFKRVAKKLQKNWPGAQPLPLASAQQILARGLGYRDLHDLERSVQAIGPDTPVPSTEKIRDGISSSVSAFCQSSKISDIDDAEIGHLVELLPLQEFGVFQHSGLGSTSFPAGSASIGVLHLENQLEERSSTFIGADAHKTDKSRPVSERVNVIASTRVPQLIDESGLLRIREAVKRTGSLRDQCFVMALLQGIRASTLAKVAPRDVFSEGGKEVIRVQVPKHSVAQTRMVIPLSVSGLYKKYISQEGLSNSAYLFPSLADVTRPMSSDEMRKAVIPYLRQALPDQSQATLHNLRQSASVRNYARGTFTVAQLKKFIGHQSTDASSLYLPKSPDDPIQ
jgi:hypothetical protein